MAIVKLDGWDHYTNVSVNWDDLDKFAISDKPIKPKKNPEKVTEIKNANIKLISTFKLDCKLEGKTYLKCFIDLLEHKNKFGGFCVYGFTISRDGKFCGEPHEVYSVNPAPKFIKNKCSFDLKSKRLKLRWDFNPKQHHIRYTVEKAEEIAPVSAASVAYPSATSTISYGPVYYTAYS
mgnify:CR=1 FL=1